MKMANPTKTGSPKYIALLLLIQSASIVGIFSIQRFPRIVRVVGSDLIGSITRTTEAAAVIIAVALVLIARGIALRRYRAWQLATGLQSTLLLLALFHGVHTFISREDNLIEEFRKFGLTHFIFGTILLSLLVYKKSEFSTVSNPHTRASDVYYFLQVSGVSYFVGTVIVFFKKDNFIHSLAWHEILQTSFLGLLGISGPVPYTINRHQAQIENLLLGLGLFIAVSTLIRALRPVEHISAMNSAEKIVLKELIEKYPSDDSFAYFALRDDKDVIWADNGKAAITYSVINGTMIASGDPLGDPECWPAAISNFINEARNHAWIPAVYGCTEKAGEIWQRETNCDALEIGDEAVVLVSNFDLETPQLKRVRQLTNKALKLGYVTHTQKISEMSVSDRTNLARHAQEWRRGGDERGYSMALGRFCDLQDADAVITWATLNGEFKALLQFVPWGVDGLSLDLMRRSRDAVSGVNELMITATIEYAKRVSVSRISLNFATFRSTFEKGERLGAGPIIRLNHRMLVALSRVVQMQTLYRFNVKFHPIWEPRYILFPSIGHLGRITIAILKIESLLPTFKIKK